jgi:hypothetical protein
VKIGNRVECGLLSRPSKAGDYDSTIQRFNDSTI